MHWLSYLSLLVGIPVYSQIIFSEVMYDPAGNEYHDEFIEVFNVSFSDSFDITGLQFSDSSGMDALLPHRGGTKIAPRRFAVILDGSYFGNSKAYEDLIPDSVIILKTYDKSLGSGGLSNSTAEHLYLLDSTGLILCDYRYTLGNTPGHSDEKILLDSSNTADNWGNSSQTGGTPGYRNSISPFQIDPGLSKASLILPERIYTEDPIPVLLTIHNFGIDPRLPPFQVLLFYDSNENDSYDGADATIFTYKVEAETLINNYTLHTTINQLPAGHYQWGLIIYSQPDHNELNNLIITEFMVLDRSRHVHINEIKFLTINDEPEWLELTNSGTNHINLFNWGICDLIDTAWIDTSVYLFPGQYKVLVRDSLNPYYPVDDSLLIKVPDLVSFNNNSDEIRLVRPDGSWLEMVEYEVDWLMEHDTKRSSLERINPGLFANARLNWGPCILPEGGTPGSQNSIFSQLLAEPEHISVYPNPFSPDHDGCEDVAIISGALPDKRAHIRARIFDIRGRLIRTLRAYQFTGRTFRLVWDGLDEHGHPARMGIYVIFLEAINEATGMLREMKCSVVVARKL